MDDGTAAGPALRWARALVLASVATGSGALSHLSADGLLPGPGAVVGLLMVSAVGVAPVLGREASTARVVGLLVAWQAVIHVALTGMAGHRSDAHDEAGATAKGDGVPVPGLEWAEDVLSDLSGPHAVMALGHLLAAAGVGLWLAAGERALWTLFALATRRAARCLEVLLLSGPWILNAFASGRVGRVTAPDVEVVLKTPSVSILARAVPRRGPPSHSPWPSSTGTVSRSPDQGPL